MDDLKNLNVIEAADKGATMKVMHPTEPRALFSEAEDGKKFNWEIDVLGSDSDKFKQLSRKKAQKMISSQNKKKSIDLESAESENVDILARCTTGWRNIIIDGSEIEFSYESAKRLYREYPFIKEQVDEFIGDRDNFLA